MDNVECAEFLKNHLSSGPGMLHLLTVTLPPLTTVVHFLCINFIHPNSYYFCSSTKKRGSQQSQENLFMCNLYNPRLQRQKTSGKDPKLLGAFLAQIAPYLYH